MFAYEAAILLKDVACPFCKKSMHLDMGSPFRSFSATDLNDQCDTKECKHFFRELNTQFQAYDAGQISQAELQDWLQKFRA